MKNCVVNAIVKYRSYFLFFFKLIISYSLLTNHFGFFILFLKSPNGISFLYTKLARQNQDWLTIVNIYDTSTTINDYPNDPVARLVFIESFAHIGNLSKSLDLSNKSINISPKYKNEFCRLWGRINQQTDILFKELSELIFNCGDKLNCIKI